MSSLKRHAFAIILFLNSALILSVSIYSAQVTHRISDIHTPLSVATMSIQLDLQTAHLMLEELISGDNSITTSQISGYIQQALSSCQTMLWGGNLKGIPILPVQDTTVISKIENIQFDINFLKTLMDKRLSKRQESQPGSEADIEFDSHYDTIMQKTSDLEHRLSSLIKSERADQKRNEHISIILLTLLLLGMLAFSISQRKKQMKLVQKLKQLSTHDALTGIHNRRHFNTVLQKNWNDAIRSKTPITLAMCDIDFFKNYNDTLGHQAGDTCLTKVAKVLSNLLKRPTDSVSRYGGEEFAFVFPFTNGKGAEQVMQELQHNLRTCKIHHPNSNVSSYVTLSIGINSCIPTAENSLDSFIQQADQALYEAKEKGRNRIASSQ
ncbi:MAG: GGDEF domain-containing protein [Ghiorsea sp.]|nr:GGDEF domain-containing protein [Ghiorsea sp.]